jgi:hypothetical protein
MALTALTFLLSANIIIKADHRPGHAPGGGNPGGGGGTQSRFSVLEIPIDNGRPVLSEANSAGVITVKINGTDAGYGSAAFARVSKSDRTVLSYGFLPEPTFVDPSDGITKNGGSSAIGVNSAGHIVGNANTYDTSSADVNPSRAQLWVYGGAGYTRTALPELPGAIQSSAYGINSQGAIVGQMDVTAGSRAVVWDADTLAVSDLNSPELAASGWELNWASGINDEGVITGTGHLNGVFRGFVLDRTTQQISAVPLLAPAVGNDVNGINAHGRVVGSMWDGGGNPWGSNPDFHPAYTWNGNGTDPEFLPSLTNNTSIAIGLNDADATVGISIAPEDGIFPTTVPTLWEPDEHGIMQAIDLRNEIPEKPAYRLEWAHDINNDGWIGAFGRKFHKGQYSWPALLLIPNATTAPSSAAVPEPSAAVLLTATLVGGLCFSARRRSQPT